MAGSGKGKKKKSRGKSHKSNNKQHESSSSSSNIDLSKQESKKVTEDHKGSGDKDPSSSTDFEVRIENLITSFERQSINPGVRSRSERNVPSSQYSRRLQDLPWPEMDFVKSLTDCPAGVPFQEWIRTISDDAKDKLAMELKQHVMNIEAILEEKRECAIDTVMETTERLIDDRMQRRDLRLEKREADGILKQKKENSLKAAYPKLEHASQTIRKLDAKNQRLRAKIADNQLKASESERKTLQAEEERKLRKEYDESEKEIMELKRQNEEEKGGIEEMEKELKNINEDVKEKQAMLIKQEEEAKKQAKSLLLEEKRLKQIEKKDSKSRLASLQQHECEKNHQSPMDSLKKLKEEVSQLKADQESSSSDTLSSSPPFIFPLSGRTKRRVEVPSSRGRQCIVCFSNDSNILFLPCAHQVLCSKCNDEIFEAFENLCPCCKAQIGNRVKVSGPNS